MILLIGYILLSQNAENNNNNINDNDNDNNGNNNNNGQQEEKKSDSNVCFVSFMLWFLIQIILKYNLLMFWVVAVAVIFFYKYNTYWSILYGLCLPYQKSNGVFVQYNDTDTTKTDTRHILLD